MTDKLKPCPFCGNVPVLSKSGIDASGTMIECVNNNCVNPHTSWIECVNNNCVNPHTSWYGENHAITIWNTRAPTKDREFLIALSKRPARGGGGKEIVMGENSIARGGNGGSEYIEESEIIKKIRNHLEKNPCEDMLEKLDELKLSLVDSHLTW